MLQWQKRLDRFIRFDFEWVRGHQKHYSGRITSVATSIDPHLVKSVIISVASIHCSGPFQVWPEDRISNIRFEELILRSSECQPMNWDGEAVRSHWEAFPPGCFMSKQL